MTKGGNKRAELPSRQQVLDYIRGSEIPVGKREIARAFGIKGADRIPLKAMLKDLEHAGEIDRGRHRRMGAPGALPEVTVLTVLGPDTDGELMAAPATGQRRGGRQRDRRRRGPPDLPRPRPHRQAGLCPGRSRAGAAAPPRRDEL